jgi:N-formylglutamate amidohydrolase
MSSDQSENGDPAWSITRVGAGSSPVIVHVPHAGTWIPDEARLDLLLDDIGLDAELALMTDWFTDRLAFDGLARAEAPATVFANRASRLLVDPERFVGPEEPMLAVGMGAVYLSTSDLRRLRVEDPGRDERFITRWFDPYAAALTALVDQTLSSHGHVVIVDLHSFPSNPLPYEFDPSARRPGICIGTDPFHTPAHLIEAVTEAFADSGWDIATDTPFAGTYVPLRHLGRTPEVTSVMVEVRRDLYQEEPGGDQHDGYDLVVTHLASLFLSLAQGGRQPS